MNARYQSPRREIAHLRYLAATLVSPMAFVVGMAIFAMVDFLPGVSAPARLGEYVWDYATGAAATAYAFGLPAGGVMWLLSWAITRKTSARLHALVVLLMFTALCCVPIALVPGAALNSAAFAALIGAPMAFAYALIIGAPWRLRNPRAITSSTASTPS